jgi:hypothetical protein
MKWFLEVKVKDEEALNLLLIFFEWLKSILSYLTWAAY